LAHPKRFSEIIGIPASGFYIKPLSAKKRVIMSAIIGGEGIGRIFQLRVAVPNSH
jgi:hypothetical protein